jgi:hypothetical protein
MRQLILPLFIIIAATSCDFATQSKSEPVTITAPESSHYFQTNDSSFLKLKINEDKFEIDFLNKVTVIDNINNLDTFLRNNIPLINKEKVVITNYDTINNNRNLHDLLAKYGIVKFRVNR